MPPHPHGPGFSGGLHSHNPEFPNDEWNLYSHIDTNLTSALNISNPISDVLGIFKPFALRTTENPTIYSDADEEAMIIIRFVSPVHVRKLMVIGGGETHDQHPSMLKCYVNREDLDFTNVEEVQSVQEFQLPLNIDGTVELITSIHSFTNINVLILYFPSNYGADTTALKYIGLQGEHTHYRREAVHTEYELLCTHQEIKQGSDDLFSKESHMH